MWWQIVLGGKAVFTPNWDLKLRPNPKFSGSEKCICGIYLCRKVMHKCQWPGGWENFLLEARVYQKNKFTSVFPIFPIRQDCPFHCCGHLATCFNCSHLATHLAGVKQMIKQEGGTGNIFTAAFCAHWLCWRQIWPGPSNIGHLRREQRSDLLKI